MEMLLAGIAMGIGGTLAMDVWAWVLARTGVAPFPNWAMPGRWLAHVFRGRIFHDDIGQTEAVQGEQKLGWAFHYGVGIAYGVIFLILAGAEWLVEPVFFPLWVFAILTIAAGWFLLQPGMGLGWAASRTPNPWKVRVLGLVAHTVFAIGMYSAALAI